MSVRRATGAQMKHVHPGTCVVRRCCAQEPAPEAVCLCGTGGTARVLLNLMNLMHWLCVVEPGAMMHWLNANANA